MGGTSGTVTGPGRECRLRDLLVVVAVAVVVVLEVVVLALLESRRAACWDPWAGVLAGNCAPSST